MSGSGRAADRRLEDRDAERLRRGLERLVFEVAPRPVVLAGDDDALAGAPRP